MKALFKLCAIKFQIIKFQIIIFVCSICQASLLLSANQFYDFRRKKTTIGQRKLWKLAIG